MPRYLRSLPRSKFGTDLSKTYIVVYVLFLSAGECESGSFPTQKMCNYFSGSLLKVLWTGVRGAEAFCFFGVH